MQVTLEDSERQECEIWSRCMGYHRPIDSWNRGKQQEHRDRAFFKPESIQRIIEQGDSNDRCGP